MRQCGGDYMIFYSDCDYFNEYRDDEFSSYPDECESCYRYRICLHAYNKLSLEDKNNDC